MSTLLATTKKRGLHRRRGWIYLTPFRRWKPGTDPCSIDSTSENDYDNSSTAILQYCNLESANQVTPCSPFEIKQTPRLKENVGGIERERMSNQESGSSASKESDEKYERASFFQHILTVLRHTPICASKSEISKIKNSLARRTRNLPKIQQSPKRKSLDPPAPSGHRAGGEMVEQMLLMTVDLVRNLKARNLTKNMNERPSFNTF